MRIELNAGGLGRSTVNDFQDNLNRLISEAQNNAEAFGTVKNAVYNLNGGVANMQHAMELLHSRETHEQERKEYLQDVSNQYNEFLTEAFRTDSSVGSIFDPGRYYKNYQPPITITHDHGNSLLDAIRDSLGIGIGIGLRGTGLFETLRDGIGKIMHSIGDGLGFGKEVIQHFIDTMHDPATIQGLTVSGAEADSDPKHAWIFGSKEGNTEFLGVDASGKMEGELIGGSAKGKVVSTWSKEKGTFGTYLAGEAEGHLAKGSVSGSYGYLSGSAEATAGQVGAKGKVGLTLFENNKFTPYVGAEVSAEARGVTGKANVSLGTDAADIHGSADGTLGLARAYAKGGLGKVDEGEYGVKGTAGAEAYAAEGTVKGGFNLAGIKFDFGLTGKAGGAGVKAGGHATTKGVGAEVGAGLGLGAGFKVDIDWSGFSLKKLNPLNWF